MRFGKSLIALLSAGVALVATAAQATPLFSDAGLTNTITFNEVTVSGGTAITNQFSAFGATFSTGGPGAWYASGNPGGYSANPNFAATYLDNFTGGGSSSTYMIAFGGVVSAAGAWFEYNTGSPAATYSSYLNGVLQESFNYNNVSCCSSTEFIGFAGIFDELRISNVTGTNFIMDTLRFTPGVEVPAPGALALLGLGLLGVSGLRRKRKAA